MGPRPLLVEAGTRSCAGHGSEVIGIFRPANILGVGQGLVAHAVELEQPSSVGQFLETRGAHVLAAEHGLEPFEVPVLSLERTLTEKVLALMRTGYQPNAVAELQAKIHHMYNLYHLLK